MSQVQTVRDSGANLKSLMETYERQLILGALGASAGNQRRAARALGLLPTTLHEKMKRLGIRRRRSGDGDDSDAPEATAGN